jgi:hypothetical protein
VDFVDDVNKAGFGVKDVLEVIGFVRKYAAKGGVAYMMKTTICTTEVLASFQPIIGLFSKLSSDKSAPGDLLDKEIADIRSDIAVVRTVANAAAGLVPAPTTSPVAGPSGGVSWSLGSMSLGAAGGSGSTQAAPTAVEMGQCRRS